MAKCLADHVCTDEHEQNAGNPVVKSTDVFCKGACQQPAQKRHQRLKAAEISADDQRVLRPHLLHGQSLADGHRKGIHRQRNSRDD